jgi:hypothetical protein
LSASCQPQKIGKRSGKQKKNKIDFKLTYLVANHGRGPHLLPTARLLGQDAFQTSEVHDLESEADQLAEPLLEHRQVAEQIRVAHRIEQPAWERKALRKMRKQNLISSELKSCLPVQH